MTIQQSGACLVKLKINVRVSDFKDTVAFIVLDGKAKMDLGCVAFQLVRKYHSKYDEVPHII